MRRLTHLVLHFFACLVKGCELSWSNSFHVFVSNFLVIYFLVFDFCTRSYNFLFHFFTGEAYFSFQLCLVMILLHPPCTYLHLPTYVIIGLFSNYFLNVTLSLNFFFASPRSSQIQISFQNVGIFINLVSIIKMIFLE